MNCIRIIFFCNMDSVKGLPESILFGALLMTITTIYMLPIKNFYLQIQKNRVKSMYTRLRNPKGYCPESKYQPIMKKCE